LSVESLYLAPVARRLSRRSVVMAVKADSARFRRRRGSQAADSSILRALTGLSRETAVVLRVREVVAISIVKQIGKISTVVIIYINRKLYLQSLYCPLSSSSCGSSLNKTAGQQQECQTLLSSISRIST
jgi:hypothetical protein